MSRRPPFEEPNSTIEQRVWNAAYWLVAVAVSIALACAVFGAEPAPPKPLCLCYDDSRHPEALATAKLGGYVVLNVDDGRGGNASEAKRWDAFGAKLRAGGGVTLGYVDFLDRSGIRKADSRVLAECIAWINAGHSGVWLDDALDNAKDAGVIRAVQNAKPNAIIIANPGTRVKGPLKSLAKVLLCESEDGRKTDYTSTAVIAFASTSVEAQTVRIRASANGVKLLAVEPRSTYHVPGVEYQKPNPFAPK